MHILLVEDNRGDVFLIQEAASQLNEELDMTVAADGREATRILSKGNLRPDLVILDINLPFKNGIEILKEIKKDKRYCCVPVVMFSSSGDSVDRERVLELGAKAFVTKPIELEDYITTVGSILAMA